MLIVYGVKDVYESFVLSWNGSTDLYVYNTQNFGYYLVQPGTSSDVSTASSRWTVYV